MPAEAGLLIPVEASLIDTNYPTYSEASHSRASLKTFSGRHIPLVSVRAPARSRMTHTLHTQERTHPEHAYFFTARSSLRMRMNMNIEGALH